MESNGIFIFLWIFWLCLPVAIGFWAYILGRSALAWGGTTLILGIAMNAFMFFFGSRIVPRALSSTDVIFWASFQFLFPFIIMATGLVTSGPTTDKKYKNLEKKKNRERALSTDRCIKQELEKRKDEIHDGAYAQAFDEIETGNFKKSLMARAIAEAKGDESKARANYINNRADEIISSQIESIKYSFATTEQNSPPPEQIIDASGNLRPVRRLENGQIEVVTIFGKTKKFSTLEEAKKYFNG